MISYDLLVPTIPHRHEKLCTLLAELDRQWQPGFGVRVLRDNLERPGVRSYEKWQNLVESSYASYVSWAGDDDMVHPEYVARIMSALSEKPDYVGFAVKFTQDGVQQMAVEHSLMHGRWAIEGLYLRDINHCNPIRRELALLYRWGTGEPDQDEGYADCLRATGLVKTEVFIPQQMYWYQRAAQGGNFWAQRAPVPEPLPELPAYPWVTYL
jgi:hypothetical protein